MSDNYHDRDEWIQFGEIPAHLRDQVQAVWDDNLTPDYWIDYGSLLPENEMLVHDIKRHVSEAMKEQATIETLRRRVAELEGERATPRQFFSYDPDDGFEEFDTAEEAKAHAETSLDLWRDSAGDGWSDESMRVCWGIICQSIRIVNQQEYDPEKHVFVSPDCAWVEERILCSEDASKEISRLEAENAELKRQVEALREACKAADDAFDKLDPPKDTRCGMAWRKVLEALHEAANTGE